MRTIKLAPDSWDLTLDGRGNIQILNDASALAQNVANSVRAFRGEVYYNTARGVPYFSDVLGKRPPNSFIAGLVEREAMRIVGVRSAAADVSLSAGRTITGTILVNGATVVNI